MSKIRELKKRVQTETVSLQLLKEYDIEMSEMEFEMIDKQKEYGYLKIDNDNFMASRVSELLQKEEKYDSHATKRAASERVDEITKEKKLKVDVKALSDEKDSHVRTFHLGKTELGNDIQATANVGMFDKHGDVLDDLPY